MEYVSDRYEDPDTLVPAVLYDHCELREWRHLDILHYQTYVCCRIPRVKCKDGKVKQVAIGWAGKHDRHSYLFEIKIIDLLLETKTPKIMGCGFRLVNRIMHRCVERGLNRRDLTAVPFEHISIDEKSFKKGHQYVTVVSHPRVEKYLQASEKQEQEYILSHPVEIIEKSISTDEIYDSRLSCHVNRLLKSIELLVMQQNIFTSLSEQHMTQKLGNMEKGILKKKMERLTCSLLMSYDTKSMK